MKIHTHPPIRRLIFIDEEIRHKKYPNCSTLAASLGVDPKTVQRDIAFLRDELHAPIEFDFQENGYFYTEPDYFLPSVHLTEKDIFAFKMAQTVLKPYENTQYFEALKKSFEKILRYLPDHANLDSLEGSFSFDQEKPVPIASAQIMQLLKDSILQRTRVIMTYHTFSSDEVKQRNVDPYCLLNRQGRWYLIGQCHLRKEILMFAVNRILTLKSTGEKFKKKKGFNLKKYLGESFSLERGGKVHSIQLHFSTSPAKWVKERIWHPTQRIEECPDGSILFSIEVKGLQEVMRWVLQYGAGVRVLQPDELKRMVKEEIRRMAVLYD